MAVKYECRGYMVSPPRNGRGRGGWAPFTVIWGGKQNRATGKNK